MAQVVRFARETHALCVRGNHDDAALAAYYAWQASGDSPLDSKYHYVEQLSPADVRFLEELPFTLTLPAQNALVVHAGLVPGVALQAQRPIDMYKMRFVEYVSQNRSGAEQEMSEWTASETRGAAQTCVQWATQWPGPEHVFFGHDAVPGLQREAFATGLDTGCCYGRQLTACILPVRSRFVSWCRPFSLSVDLTHMTACCLDASSSRTDARDRAGSGAANVRVCR